MERQVSWVVPASFKQRVEATGEEGAGPEADWFGYIVTSIRSVTRYVFRILLWIALSAVISVVRISSHACCTVSEL